jgi:cation diffusion facilitator family transporter
VVAAPARADLLARVLVRVLALNLLVAGAKLVFGYLSGSVSIVSDGFHSLSDATSNVMGLVGLRAARKPPDANHPYGHRKFETIAAAGIFIFLLLAVVEVVQSALGRLRSGGGEIHLTAASFLVMLVTLAINVLVVRYESKKGKELASELLLADAAHTQSDVLTSCAVLVSLGGVALGYPQLDAIGALVVAVFIARTGFEIARETTGILADRAVMNGDDIRDVVMSTPGVVGCHHIRTRGSLDHTFLDLHVWFPENMSLSEAHRLSHVVKDRLMARFPQIADAIIHIEPPMASADDKR